MGSESAHKPSEEESNKARVSPVPFRSPGKIESFTKGISLLCIFSFSHIKVKLMVFEFTGLTHQNPSQSVSVAGLLRSS